MEMIWQIESRASTKPIALPTESARVWRIPDTEALHEDGRQGVGPFRIYHTGPTGGAVLWRFFRPGISTQLPGEIVPQTGTASGTKCASGDTVRRQQQRRLNVAVNHPIVDVVQNREKVNTDISFTPVSADNRSGR